jgi:hypothetical protein
MGIYTEVGSGGPSPQPSADVIDFVRGHADIVSGMTITRPAQLPLARCE